MKQILCLILGAIFLTSLATAMTVGSVQTDSILPGETGSVRITVENTLENDVTDVVLTLRFDNTQFISVGSSSDSEDEINDGDEEQFSYDVKASQDIQPGDYNIPYTLTYIDSDGIRQQTNGSIGITVRGDPDLTFSAETSNPVVGQQGTITLRIVNRGFADAKFVLVKITPDGYTLLSSPENYIGTIDSDDFETATFDVIFKDDNPTLSAVVQYRNFDNDLVTKNVNLAVTAYTQDEAVQLGIVKKSNTAFIIGIVVVLIVAWLIWRAIKRRRRMKRSMMEK